MNSRTVMMERFQDAEFSWHCCPQKTVTIPRSVCVLYLLFTQPSLIRSFHSSDPCFSVSCPKGVGYARVYCSRLYCHHWQPWSNHQGLPVDKATMKLLPADILKEYTALSVICYGNCLFHAASLILMAGHGFETRRLIFAVGA